MKVPQRPPDYDETTATLLAADPEAWMHALGPGKPTDVAGRYLHWDQMRRRDAPDGLTLEQWWLRTERARRSLARSLPLKGIDGAAFRFCNIDSVQQAVHLIDQRASGQILIDDDVANPATSDRYLVNSLIEESIRSSQLEGASTTRQAAKELLQSGRTPRNRSERMIRNNFAAMRRAVEMADSDEPLTVEAVLELHRVVTEHTLNNPEDAGRLQAEGEDRIVVHWEGEVLHRPPAASELPARLQRLCDFANGEPTQGFIHPVVRAIVIHFWLAYDHPFVDGNGRTARALFYWSMLKDGYWLAQYLSISSILRQAPAQYARSFLLVETDQNDMTYFINHQLDVMQRAIDALATYLQKKVGETRQLESQLRTSSNLNHRQLVVVGDALRDPSRQFTINAQATKHGVTYQSARTDLLGLESLGLLRKQKVGKKFVFRAEADMAVRLQAAGGAQT